MNKGLKAAIYATMIGVAGYFGYTIYQFMKESDKEENKNDTLDEDTQEELLEIADVKTQSDGTYLIGTINAVVDLHIHNVNNFEYWFVINDISCTQGYGELNSFTFYSASNMEILQPISLNSNVIGYQFLESQIVFVEIIIACKDNYDAYLDAITISFYLNVGGFIQEGGALPTINGVYLLVSLMPPISEEVIITQQN